jgi:peptidoglycan hydrolase-like protein with peptidoglycan-binding domain
MPAAHAFPGSPLHVGSRGPAVGALQRRLNALRDGARPLGADDDFGEDTARAVEWFQTLHKLGTDGVVDQVVWHAIFDLPAPQLHPHEEETAADKLRRLRVELLARARELRRLRPGSPRRRAVRARWAKLVEAVQRLVRSRQAPHVIGRNGVRGGTPGDRVRFAADETLRRYRAGSRRSFYEQRGDWTVEYALLGEPRGYRSDCSQWIASLFKSCGLPDPSDTGYTWGYTGTLAQHGTKITREQALREREKPVLVIWDPVGPAGHVTVLAPTPGNPTRTIGHGTAPIAEWPLEVFDYKPGGPGFYRY